MTDQDLIDRFKILSEKKTDGALTETEAQEIETLLATHADLFVFLRAKDGWQQKLNEVLSHAGKITDDIDEDTYSEQAPVRTMSRKWYYVAAAAALVFITTGLLLWGPHHTTLQAPVAAQTHDFKPGGNRAILTLADGSSVVLDSARNGTLAQQGNSRVEKLADGKLAYTANGQTAAIGFNSIATPAGGVYQVRLPDGSGVWLNAASSIRFPTIFSGPTREVSITGEAYFDITKDATMPFHVLVNDMDVQVLGTRFDINSYSNEPSVRTTLVQGSVKVSLGQQAQDRTQEAVLKPGQQAQWGAGNNDGKTTLRIIHDIDADQAIAWVGGNFEFNEESIESVMRQLERWYNIEVRFDHPSNIHISGSVSKNKNFSQIMDLLKLSGVNCTIDGRKVIVR